jgi:hypothetical protein
MRTITNLQAAGQQTFKTPIEAGGQAEITLIYGPITRMWYANIKYGTCTINGVRLARSVNVMHQYRNACPFGIAVITRDEAEPFLINDFSTGRVQIGILTREEVQEYQGFLEGQNA